MRIAQLANFVSPTSGGMKTAIDALGRGYVEAGHQRLLIIPGPRDSLTETDAGLIAQIRSPRISTGYRMIVNDAKVCRLLHDFGPTSLECSDKWTLTPLAGWARRHKIGSVLFSHERLEDMLTDWLSSDLGRRPVARRNQQLARRFDRVVVTSAYAAREFADTPARLRIVPLGVDLQTFTMADLPPHLAGRPGIDRPIRLSYSGRLSHEKSPQLAIQTLIELCRLGIPAQLHLYGAGPDEGCLRAQGTGYPVFFHGYIPSRAQLAASLGRADLGLSLCPHETFGLAALETLASGTPVVTATTGGAREIVTNQCGAWAAPQPVAMARAIQGLIPRLGHGMRAHARERAEQYSWTSSTQAMLAVHRQISR